MSELENNFEIWLNHFVRLSKNFDWGMFFISSSFIFKFMLPIVIILYLWFRSNRKDIRLEGLLLVLSTISSMFVSRALVSILPHRTRPILDQKLNLQTPQDFPLSLLSDESSFPSDHATLFFTLATAIYFMNRGLGILAFLHAIIIVSFPRIYLGYHYPSDIFTGGLIGVIICIIFFKIGFFRNSSSKLLNKFDKYPAFVDVVFMVFILEMGTRFAGIRLVVKIFSKMLKIALS